MGNIAVDIAKNIDFEKVVNKDINKTVFVDVVNPDQLAEAEADAEAFGMGALAQTDTFAIVTETEAFAYAESTAAIDDLAIPPDDDFDIELIFFDDSLTPDQQAVVRRAANRWEEIIIGDLEEVLIEDVQLGQPYNRFESIDLLVDDIAILVSATEIDKVGHTLARGGARALRRDNFLPAAGVVTFDSLDLPQLSDDNKLFDTALHEIGHALGIGRIGWDAQRLLNRDNPINGVPPQPPNFLGEKATNEYNSIFFPIPNTNTAMSVPTALVKDKEGDLVPTGHWAESARGDFPGLDNELMTPFIDAGAQPLSEITAASLVDLGYEVDVNKADPYTPPSTLQSDALESEIIGFDIEYGPEDFIKLGGRAFNDVNENDLLDEGDELLPGVVVTLRNALGTPIDTTVTDAEGSYEFQNLTPANYIVGFEFDFGNNLAEFVTPFQGSDPLFDSDVVETISEFPLSGITDTIVLVTEAGFVTEDIFDINAGVVIFPPIP